MRQKPFRAVASLHRPNAMEFHHRCESIFDKFVLRWIAEISQNTRDEQDCQMMIRWQAERSHIENFISGGQSKGRSECPMTKSQCQMVDALRATIYSYN